MNYFILSIMLAYSIILAESYAPLNFESNQNDEKYLKDAKKFKNLENIEEGSGEGIEDLVVSSISAESPSTAIPSSSTTTALNISTKSTARPIRCYDISRKCSKIKPLCSRDEYKSIMMRKCARTCGFCPQFARLPIAERCRDSFRRCPSWAQNGFCHSTYYTLDERKDYCRKSCGDC